MGKYSIQPIFGFGYTAGPKAVTDATSILGDNGYVLFYTNRIRENKKVPRIIGSIIDLLRIIVFSLSLSKTDDIVIQWPVYCSKLSTNVLISIIQIKNIKFSLLIHDIQNLRMGIKTKDLVFEKYIKNTKNVIVHSENMRTYLQSLEVSLNKISILTTFDYITDDQLPIRPLTNKIVYAGNLVKSAFLGHIDDKVLEQVQFNCYGNGGDSLKKGLVYKGFFNPDNVSVLDGSWGLVWDGDSSITCSGIYGNYLRYNSPHKASLYIVSGLPLIVWKDSALASYVEINHLGILIDSLNDLPEKIQNISLDIYSELLCNIQKEAIRLKSGHHLLKCLNFPNS
jgi:hypothetical protein